MDPIFFYGTLCHRPLLQIVTGRDDAALIPARLAGYRVAWAAGESFPLILAEEGAVAEGVLFTPPSPEVLERLDYYELGFGYQLRRVEVVTETGAVQAAMYVPPEAGLAVGGAWDLQDWARRWGPLTCLTAEEIMADMEARPATEVAHRFGPLRARAQARLNARQTAPTTLRRRAAPGDIRLRRRSLAYSQFFSVEEYDFTHRRFAGDHGDELNRTAFVSADAVTVLPYDPVRDRVLLVEQFRAGPYARGDAQPWMLEAIAGRIDGGETPEQAARRESVEEAGLQLRDLHRVGAYYPTPGAKTEYLYAFVALADLADDSAGFGGVPDEGEDIRSHVISFERAMALLDSGEINVGPLILLLLHLARIRDRLRGSVDTDAASDS